MVIQQRRWSWGLLRHEGPRARHRRCRAGVLSRGTAPSQPPSCERELTIRGRAARGSGGVAPAAAPSALVRWATGIDRRPHPTVAGAGLGTGSRLRSSTRFPVGSAAARRNGSSPMALVPKRVSPSRLGGRIGDLAATALPVAALQGRGPRRRRSRPTRQSTYVARRQRRESPRLTKTAHAGSGRAGTRHRRPATPVEPAGGESGACSTIGRTTIRHHPDPVGRPFGWPPARQAAAPIGTPWGEVNETALRVRVR